MKSVLIIFFIFVNSFCLAMDDSRRGGDGQPPKKSIAQIRSERGEVRRTSRQLSTAFPERKLSQAYERIDSPHADGVREKVRKKSMDPQSVCETIIVPALERMYGETVYIDTEQAALYRFALDAFLPAEVEKRTAYIIEHVVNSVYEEALHLVEQEYKELPDMMKKELLERAVNPFVQRAVRDIFTKSSK